MVTRVFIVRKRIIPVSYTHLDVYKRQGLTRENKAGMVRDYFANGRISYDDMQSLLAGI